MVSVAVTFTCVLLLMIGFLLSEHILLGAISHCALEEYIEN